MKYSIKKTIISLMIITMLITTAPLPAHASKQDWIYNGQSYTLPEITTCAVKYLYYTYGILHDIHFSLCDGDRMKHHITYAVVNGPRYYYYGNTGSFNIENIPSDIKNSMLQAWNNFVTSFFN